MCYIFFIHLAGTFSNLSESLFRFSVTEEEQENIPTCPQESLRTEKGNFRWVEAYINSTVKIICPHGTVGEVEGNQVNVKINYCPQPQCLSPYCSPPQCLCRPIVHRPIFHSFQYMQYTHMGGGVNHSLVWI